MEAGFFYYFLSLLRQIQNNSQTRSAKECLWHNITGKITWYCRPKVMLLEGDTTRLIFDNLKNWPIATRMQSWNNIYHLDTCFWLEQMRLYVRATVCLAYSNHNFYLNRLARLRPYAYDIPDYTLSFVQDLEYGLLVNFENEETIND